MARHGLPADPRLGDLQAADVADYLPNDILTKVDRMSMAHGLEVRAPFLQPAIAEFALSLPDELRCGIRGRPKRLLRELARRTYGPEIADAPKQGFSIPVHQWLRGPLRETAEDLLGEEALGHIEELDPAAVRRVWHEHLVGRRSHGWELWGLMVLSAWHRARVQTRPQAPAGGRSERRPVPVSVSDRSVKVVKEVGVPTQTTAELQRKTIEDFGEQWVRYSDNAGFYGSLELFQDAFGPLLSPQDIEGRRVADIGSGTGRIVHMLLMAGAAHVTAIEPSESFAVLEANTRALGDRVRCVKARGDEIPEEGFDLVVSYGVLHHIPDPQPVVAAAWRALRPGGRIAVWLYGREGNELYLALAEPLRAITTRLPHAALSALSWLLTPALSGYVVACRVLPLPLRDYMLRVIGRLSWKKRYLNIYDQLNPAYARYYRRDEAIELLAGAGFADVRVHHRHGYSWTVTGIRPEPHAA